MPADSCSPANDGIRQSSTLGSFVRYLSCRLHLSIPSRHRPLDPERAATQGPGDGTCPASPRIQHNGALLLGYSYSSGPKSISYLRRRLGDNPKNTACTASTTQHPYLGPSVPGLVLNLFLCACSSSYRTAAHLTFRSKDSIALAPVDLSLDPRTNSR